MNLTRADRATELPRALLAYAVALTIFLLVPPTLKATVGPPRGFTLQEAAHLFTPVVVIPLAWLVLDRAGGLRGRTLVAFLIIGAVWVEGQGLHLGTNAIGDVFPSGPARDAFYATDAGDLDHWLDEVLSHWMWHLAWAALSVLMLWTATRPSVAQPRPVRGAMTVLAGLLHGITFFFVTAEGATTALGIPLSIVLLGWGGRQLRRGSAHPIVWFLVVASATTVLADLGWIALHGWPLVEPCEVLHC